MSGPSWYWNAFATIDPLISESLGTKGSQGVVYMKMFECEKYVIFNGELSCLFNAHHIIPVI